MMEVAIPPCRSGQFRLSYASPKGEFGTVEVSQSLRVDQVSSDCGVSPNQTLSVRGPGLVAIPPPQSLRADQVSSDINRKEALKLLIDCVAIPPCGSGQFRRWQKGVFHYIFQRKSQSLRADQVTSDDEPRSTASARGHASRNPSVRIRSLPTRPTRSQIGSRGTSRNPSVRIRSLPTAIGRIAT